MDNFLDFTTEIKDTKKKKILRPVVDMLLDMGDFTVAALNADPMDVHADVHPDFIDSNEQFDRDILAQIKDIYDVGPNAYAGDYEQTGKQLAPMLDKIERVNGMGDDWVERKRYGGAFNWEDTDTLEDIAAGLLDMGIDIEELDMKYDAANTKLYDKIEYALGLYPDAVGWYLTQNHCRHCKTNDCGACGVYSLQHRIESPNMSGHECNTVNDVTYYSDLWSLFEHDAYVTRLLNSTGFRLLTWTVRSKNISFERFANNLLRGFDKFDRKLKSGRRGNICQIVDNIIEYYWDMFFDVNYDNSYVSCYVGEFDRGTVAAFRGLFDIIGIFERGPYMI